LPTIFDLCSFRISCDIHSWCSHKAFSRVLRLILSHHFIYFPCRSYFCYFSKGL
jgi:hypothetical protein